MQLMMAHQPHSFELVMVDTVWFAKLSHEVTLKGILGFENNKSILFSRHQCLISIFPRVTGSISAITQFGKYYINFSTTQSALLLVTDRPSANYSQKMSVPNAHARSQLHLGLAKL